MAVDRCDEAVTAPGYGFDETRLLGIVAQRCANLVDGEVDAAIEVNEGVTIPDALVNFLTGDDLSCAFDQQKKDNNLLRPEFDHVAALAQLTIRNIKLEGAKADMPD
jgi:hypothetical protein